MSTCEVPVEPSLHPALRGRFSPVRFDPHAVVSEEQVDLLLDAARLAPSAGNSQPWAFIVGKRGDRIHERIVRHLARSSAAWAVDASVLVVNLAHVYVETTTWEFSEFSRYDLGQAVAHMTMQGLAMGLGAHQFRAFDRDGLAAEFDVPSAWEATSMTALGVAAQSTAAVTASRSSPASSTRVRHARKAITWARA